MFHSSVCVFVHACNVVIIWISREFQHLLDINAQGRVSHQNLNKAELKQTLPKDPNVETHRKESNVTKRSQYG